MPADFFATGVVEVYVKFRQLPDRFYFLGTSTSYPKVAADLLYAPVKSDRTSPGPFNQMLCSEQHMVSMVLNRVNQRTYNRLRDVGNSPGAGGGWVRRIPSGNLIMGGSDVELFLRYSLTSNQFAPTPPDGANKGRLYRSALLRRYEEDHPYRVQEVGLVFECNPLPKNKDLTLFTEVEDDLPTNLTPE